MTIDTVATLTGTGQQHTLAGAGRRAHICQQLHDLASLISDLTLPIPDQYDGVHVHIALSSISDVTAVAQALRLPTQERDGQTKVVWPNGNYFGEPVSVRWYAYDEHDPTERVGDDGDGTAVPAGVDGHAPGAPAGRTCTNGGRP